MEDEGCIVQDEVDTSPLLEGHDKDRNSGTFKVTFVLEEGYVATETELDARGEGPVLQLRIVALADTELEETLGLDFEVFDFNKAGVGRETAEVGNDRASFLITTLVDEPAGGLGHEEDTDPKNDSWGELNGDGNEPCRSRLSVTLTTDEVCSFKVW